MTLMDFGDCPCTGKTLTKLVKPLVMTFLAKGQLHGYAIKRLLESQGSFAHGPPDLSGVYRSLKEMESQGYVEATWVSSDGGPPKKCFGLTPSGRACLAMWKKTLIDYRAQIDELIGFMDDLSPAELSPDVLSPSELSLEALSPDALSPEALPSTKLGRSGGKKAD